jgi:hypothetical protein
MRRKGMRFPNGIPRAATTCDLRARIVKVLGSQLSNERFCLGDIADALIRELNLTEDAGVIVGCCHD